MAEAVWIPELNGDHRPEVKNGPPIIIVGAGISGIAAAAHLYLLNFTNVRILEAGDRVGGRIHTAQFENSTVDLGAHYCYGQQDNAVHEVVVNLNLLSSEMGVRPFTPYHSSRRPLNPEYYNEIFETCKTLFLEDKQGYNRSVGEYMETKGKDVFFEKYNQDQLSCDAAMEALETYKLDILLRKGSFSWYHLPARTDFKECNGDQYLGWKGKGYKMLIDVLFNTFPDPDDEIPILPMVMFNHAVRRLVTYDTHVEVQCDHRSYIGEYVIFTPSVGVLKHTYNEMFLPPLSAEKILAIRSIGISTPIKIVYYFSEVWWSEDTRDFTFVWSNEDREAVKCEFPEAVLEDQKSWLTDVLQLIRIEGSPKMLGAWICGKSVPKVELLSDENIINGTMFLCNKFLGHLFPNITKPEKIIREKWHNNDLFYGGCSHQTLWSRSIPGESQHSILGKPIFSSTGKPRVLFGGEATSPTYYGTVHGAVESGWREAERIAALYENA